ncbi:glycosyl hydrolase [Ningiella sp. W23]|uniref:glycosyl hydrolase n=1 Tax=Ningiella sp. W23 TaxID=3023715 RepID=UPI0037582804
MNSSQVLLSHHSVSVTVILFFCIIITSFCGLSSCHYNNQSAQLSASDDKNAADHSVSSNAKMLEHTFANPPHQYKPLTWFHAMSGNMSKEGVTKDFESIAEVGIGGVMLFNVTQGIPLGDIKFNSDEHIDIITHAAKEAQRLGLSFGVHNADGWTSSGGPWITPHMSMKKLVYSEVIIEGGVIDINLPAPPSLHNYYEDVAVLAYPSLIPDIENEKFPPSLSSSDNNADLSFINDSQIEAHTTITRKDGKRSDLRAESSEQDLTDAPWIQFSYDEQVSKQSVFARFLDGRHVKPMLYVSNDGDNFTYHDSIVIRRPGKSVWASDAVFEAVAAKHFRFYFNQTVKIEEMQLSSNRFLANYLGRSSIARTDYNKLPTIGTPPPEHIIDSSKVINLTSALDQNGRLQTTLPNDDYQGPYTIMRFGFTTTGAVNIPASVEGTGLEVDKFSREAFDVHYGAYVSRVLNSAKDVAPDAMQFLEIDSFEVGGQNWTHDYETRFQERFNYSLIKYLPLFAGKFMDNAAVSEGVLWDTRTLNAELISNNYYGYFTELANKDGVKTYIEPYGFGPFNDVDAGSKANIPMGEFWLKRDNAYLSAAASSAHIYNKNIVSAEAFTAQQDINWTFHPGMAKIDGDMAFARGINEMVFHRFAHQANTHVVPGMTMNRWGAHFDRTQPWWTSAGADWFKYMARVQFMLRQGLPVADGLWFVGDAAPTSCPEKRELQSVLPRSINYDCLNAEVLLNDLEVSNGKLTLPHGAQYKWLYLSNIEKVTLASLEKLYSLSQRGALIIGQAPSTLANWRATDAMRTAFDKMVAFIWSQKTTYTELEWETLYKTHNIARELIVGGAPNVQYAQRRLDDMDIFFVYNDSEYGQVFDLEFGTKGKIPELFDPKTGESYAYPIYEFTPENTTKTQLYLSGHQSMLIVLRGTEHSMANSTSNLAPSKVTRSLLNQGLTFSFNEIGGINAGSINAGVYAFNNDTTVRLNASEPLIIKEPWLVQFSEQYGLDETYRFDTLTDWSMHPDTEIRDYSGTASYSTSITITQEQLDNHERLWIDLGDVNISAKVQINEKDLGVTWIAPHKLDITKLVKPGVNRINIEVANLWINRLIADESLPDTSGFVRASKWNNPEENMVEWYKRNQPPPVTERLTFTTQNFFSAEDERVPSGLIGPVRILFEQQKAIAQ